MWLESDFKESRNRQEMDVRRLICHVQLGFVAEPPQTNPSLQARTFSNLLSDNEFYDRKDDFHLQKYLSRNFLHCCTRTSYL